jgi:hypothetical protein
VIRELHRVRDGLRGSIRGVPAEPRHGARPLLAPAATWLNTLQPPLEPARAA